MAFSLTTLHGLENKIQKPSVLKKLKFGSNFKLYLVVPTLLGCKWTPLDEPGLCSTSVVLLTMQYFPSFKGSHGRRILKKSSSIVAVFYFILAYDNTPSATAADDFPVMKLNLLQTQKRCIKWPSNVPPVKRSNQCFGLRINHCSSCFIFDLKINT